MSAASFKDGTVPSIFIDGEAGTTGLGIRERLQSLSGITVKSIDPELRKDAKARQAMMAAVDLVVLCLPDAAAREAVALARDLGADAPRILDASTAHRTDPAWTYGFAELAEGQADAIRAARLVSNPGCYATGTIALLRPLVDCGLIPPDYPLTINAVSGYSGGGRTMIEAYEAGRAPAFELYGLGFDHKHLPEITALSRLDVAPIFIPSVGNFRQGMLVSVPLNLSALPAQPPADDLAASLAARYRDCEFVRVIGIEGSHAIGGRLDAEALNNTDNLEIFVFSDKDGGRVVLVARLDNLGKGASGAAVQNIKLMLGQ
ncbi:N-acetyl-gamma-glutamyl-phosphate reductase [Chelatococcus asaccharovorans]|uniref:N-acetyl-gamma-glutamyl-phosphate reductase n=1 Tax=Chelatococcus asaccharovorans TaxID=28210 RepID=UPI00224C73AD|nr:N-acetyl-gamma-glutamyl-phosphate reductase [Chelatococcus asaccharovorans]CAH1673494.1 N-acetyl-gamma-glutamyl-phosphate reductase [Chelatococcus asaccharovorans]CAH1675128.1 N-acetyl-gamma-glutamyl-phosphate reductase [Chelatococcus asaccharovorans]